MNKRRGPIVSEVEAPAFKKFRETNNLKKHSLDSDEEDDDNTYDESNLMDEDDIEGEEDGIAHNTDGVRTTAFNMREEMEEGSFDKDGHFLWKKENNIRDNWLDNIDWQQITPRDSKGERGLGEESDDEYETDHKFSEISNYMQMLEILQPNEDTAGALRRLAGQRMSTLERLQLKREGKTEENQEQIVKLTELANTILSRTGNMDIYQETYENITQKILDAASPPKKKEPCLDMYSDDFDSKEKQQLDEPGPSSSTSATKKLMWEFKWSKDTYVIEGPKTTEEMQEYVLQGKFKKGVWVRKSGQDQFYSSNRIDFELYLS